MLSVKLKVVGGEMGADELDLRLPAVLGRGREAAVNLSHPLVSRRHCELIESDGYVRVRDLGSLNGTFVGSHQVREATLKPGELLTVGTVTFRAMYDALADQESPAPIGLANGDTSRPVARLMETKCMEKPRAEVPVSATPLEKRVSS